MTIATIATVFVSLLQWNVLQRTDKSVREQADFTSRQLEIMKNGQRAWVSISNVQPNHPSSAPIDKPPALIVAGKYFMANMKMDIQNTGNLPALHINTVAEIRFSRGGLPGILLYDPPFPPECKEGEPRANEVGYSLFPGSKPVTISFIVGEAGDSVVGTFVPEAPKDEKFSMGLAGCILYHSAGDPTPRITTFAGVLIHDKASSDFDMYTFPPGLKGFDPSTLRYLPLDYKATAN